MMVDRHEILRRREASHLTGQNGLYVTKRGTWEPKI